MEYPCPHCERVLGSEQGLFGHVLTFHNQEALIELIGRRMKELTKHDFIQVDSHWIFAIGSFHLSLLPNRNGNFSLQVYGSLEPIPPATQYPSEPEWDKALNLANKFVRAYAVAIERGEISP